ncbi:MAG TPA: hypothetical protein VMZ49_04940 [Patescibacteria group bacterium]|nr:hypothetical protein [Patescibacteria group bacterium]
MKKIIFVILSVFLLLQQAAEPQDLLKEKVEVVNVEVPVRVFRDGVSVSGLSKEDFRLIEGKVKQTINGFYVRKKKINVQSTELQPASPAPKPRYFVLVFRILDYNQQMKNGVQYIFDHLLRENDKLLLLVNDRTLLLNQDIWQVKRQEILDQLLAEEALKARQKLEQFFMSVQKDLDQTKLRMLMERDQNFYPPRIIEFLEQYLQTWKEFKNKYLIPDLDKFYNFARHLEKVKEEKWVLTFYQIEMFPNMKISGQIRQQIEAMIGQLMVARIEDNLHGRIIGQLLGRIDRELNVAEGFPVEEVSKMLIKVDTTYHCIISGVQRESLSEDLEYKKVASDIENSLREITRRSGGEVVFSGNIGAALHSFEERDDLYYVLTYEPTNPNRKGKVRIELSNNPGCKLFYDDNIRADYIGEYLQKKKAEDPTVLLERLKLKGSNLQMMISSFKMAETAKGKNGRLKITVRIQDGENQPVYDQNRFFIAKEPLVELSIDFAFLEPGKYMFIAEASDLLTGKTAMDILQAEVD